jgi:peptidoglycan/xylan/chitin deacetylase (PgdA/CDA1 family)
MRRRWRELAFAFSIALPVTFAAATNPVLATTVERPPQFVAIAFDNCTEVSRWRELRDFAARLNEKNETIHFTFFVSGVGLLASDKRSLYEGPHQRRGYAMIPFGSNADDVKERVGLINEMQAAGHEIASHAIGHFDGRGWSAADWSREFSEYRGLIDNVAANNNLPDDVKFAFKGADIKGFRAPYLSTSAGLYPALKEAGFRYDTSGTMLPNLWPEQRGGLWRFDLAEIRLASSKKMTLSMDYNFLIAQSLGLDVSARRTRDRDEMLETYIAYFKANYFGNRAPLHIGHHFTNYHGGAYHEALTAFIERVCGLPEVQCVTYSKLADFMDSLSPETRAAYQKGDFPRATQPLILQDTPAAGLR